MHGWLIVDKPLGMTSAQMVGAVKRLLKPRKIGHGGTLDPLASGILPLALGEATKTFEYVVAHEKEYEFSVTWGESRTTDDAEGEVINRSAQRPTAEAITAILPQFTGLIQQRPPVFSAISQGGKRAYAMARAGQEVSLESRPVEVFQLEYLGSETPNISRFRVSCGKGTYIRSLARDMGEILGCYGYVSALRRVRVGRFDEKSAISLDELKEMAYQPSPNLPLLAMKDVLDDILGISLTATQARKLAQGQPLALAEIASVPPVQNGQILCCFAPHLAEIFAMAKVEGGKLKPVKVFNL
jgi:tRNA pseudouridine55 synthase